jgi:hypothetical protein
VRIVAQGLAAVAVPPLLAACPVDEPDPNDQTPPGVMFTVRFVRAGVPATGLEVGPEGETRGPLPSNTVLELTGFAGDSESGIDTITIHGDVWKECDLGNDLGQRVNATVLAREPGGSVTPPSPPLSNLGSTSPWPTTS